MITEVLTFDLKDDANLADVDAPATKIIIETIAKNVYAHAGKYVFYGNAVEKPGVGFIFVGWDSLEDQLKLVGSPVFGPQIAAFSSVATNINQMNINSTLTSSDISPALGSDEKVGVTELVFRYFPSSLAVASKDRIMATLDRIRSVIDRSEGRHMFGGWSSEDVVPFFKPEGKDGVEEKSKVLMMALGWTDIDAHMRFRETKVFKDEIVSARGDFDESKHVEALHARLRRA